MQAVKFKGSSEFLTLLFFLCTIVKGSDIKGGFILFAKGHVLTNSLIEETRAEGVMECIQHCLIKGPHCKSINYGVNSLVKGKCQINNNSAIGCNEANLVTNEDFNYYERDTGEPSFCSAAVKEQKQGIKARSCAALYRNGSKTDGVYRIDPDGQGSFDVRCDMSTSPGGWTVFRRRMDGSQDFYLGWAQYKTGFGDLSGEFWLGLDKIHRLSKAGHDILRVDLTDFNNETRYAEYGSFAVANETDKYKLTVGQYSGDTGDSLAYHNGMWFTTKDVDNDQYSGNCGKWSSGAWWYKNCYHSNLCGIYLEAGQTLSSGIRWDKLKSHSLKETEMKIRAVSQV